MLYDLDSRILTAQLILTNHFIYDVSKIDDLREKFEAARTSQLEGQPFLSELELYYGVYPCYLWDNFWLTGEATWDDMRNAFQLTQKDEIAHMIIYLPHTQLAHRLVQARQLVEARLPFARQFAAVIEANDLRGRTPLDKLSYMMEQMHEAAPEDADYFISTIADLLQNRLVLRSGSSIYRITELEMYYWNRGHQDPYIHREREQQEHGKWFFNNADCLDLTFGSKEHNTWGGILLRGLRQLGSTLSYASVSHGEEPYIAGPRNVLRELVANMDGVFTGLPQGLFLEGLSTGILEVQQPWRVARYGLKAKADDTNSDFLLRPYRFLVEEGYLRKIKDKAQVVQQAKLTREEAKAVLGYFPADLV